MQQVIGILSWVELDSHRQALHHLHVVAGRVFGRQQAEAIAARTRQVPDVALVVATEGIDVDADALATMHPRELRLLEISSDPDVVGLGHEHERLSGFDPRAKLDSASAYDAVSGRVNFRVAEVKIGLIQCGLSGLHSSFGLANHPRRGSYRRAVRV